MNNKLYDLFDNCKIIKSLVKMIIKINLES